MMAKRVDRTATSAETRRRRQWQAKATKKQNAEQLRVNASVVARWSGRSATPAPGPLCERKRVSGKWFGHFWPIHFWPIHFFVLCCWCWCGCFVGVGYCVFCCWCRLLLWFVWWCGYWFGPPCAGPLLADPPDPPPPDSPKFRLSFPPPISLCFSLLEVFQWNFGGFCEDRDPQMCTFGLSDCRVEPRRFSRSKWIGQNGIGPNWIGFGQN